MTTKEQIITMIKEEMEDLENHMDDCILIESIDLKTLIKAHIDITKKRIIFKIRKDFEITMREKRNVAQV